MPSFQRHVFVCVNERAPDDPKGSCKAKGGIEVRDKFKAELKARGLAKTIRANNAGCLDQCARGVSVVIYPEQVWYGGVTVEDVVEIVEKHLIGGQVVERLLMPDQPHVDPKRRLPIVGAVLLLAFGGIARAEAPPDPLAQGKAGEANLESQAPREGTVFAGSLGGGVMVSSGSVHEIPVLDLRLGQVMTPDTVLTFEITGGTYQHKAATQGATLIDGTGTVLVGAQDYVGPSLWIRGAGGLNIHTVQDAMTTTATTRLAGAFGAGVDLVRRHFLVLGLEVLGIGAIDAHDGLLVTGNFSVGLSYY